MKSVFLCLVIFLLFIPARSQVVQPARNHTDPAGQKQGFWEAHYPDGSVRYRGTFKNDRPVGQFTRYYPNGSKMADMDFCEAGITARAELFYQDGTRAASGIYVNENKDSVWKYFSYYDGRPAFFETYNNGVKEGASGVWYPNGGLSEIFWYESNMRHGPWQQYYENGAVRIDARFENDLRHGEFRFYNSSGSLEFSGEYYRNLMNGMWTWYDESGREQSVINYIHGKAENEDELIEQQQEMFRMIEEMKGRIPEPDESELFQPRTF
jgi:antitoxin component YwqK of YwqJK toxin-antitoxin module